jgi:site-specific recombinase XerD
VDSPNGAPTTLEAAVARFLGDLAVARSRETVKTYRAGLHRFAEFLSTLNPAPAAVGELTADHPVDFVRWLAGPTAQRATVQLYATAVARFYAFLVRERWRPDLELELMRLRLAALRGKRVRGLSRVPADGVVERLVAVARAAPPGKTHAAECIRLRNLAVVETLRGSGLRVSELVSLKRGDLDREQRRAVVTGKGGKQRLVFFTDPAWRAQLEELGITPHRFRAWFATRMVAETGDLAATQDLLGHESADTTRVYTKVAAQRLAEARRRAFAL